MDLGIKGQHFIICGATSGFGYGIARRLIDEGARITAIARGEEKLRELQDAYPDQVNVLTGDITKSATVGQLIEKTKAMPLHGILVNASGPPAKTFVETRLEDWDAAYALLLRWKVELTQALLPRFINSGYGRFLYIESSAVKQPLENLVLSTSLRLSVVGFVKTLSQELPDKGVTFNILAPGYHYTPAVERLIKKKAEKQNISNKTARQEIESGIPMKKAGDVDHLASLGAWLLSPFSDFVSGQLYAVDGGVIKSTL
jgi:3-oxoacyl-[acyl-carrier protein] reductase